MLTIVDPSFRYLQESLENVGKYLKPDGSHRFDNTSLDILKQGLPNDLAEALYDVLVFNESLFRG